MKKDAMLHRVMNCTVAWWTKRECQQWDWPRLVVVCKQTSTRATHKDFTISVIFSDFRRLSHLPPTSVLRDD